MLLYTSSSLLGEVGKGEGGDKSEQPHQSVNRRYRHSGVDHHPLAAAMSRAGQEYVANRRSEAVLGLFGALAFHLRVANAASG